MGKKRSSIILSAVMFAIMLFVTICCVVPGNEIKDVLFPAEATKYSVEEIVGVVELKRQGNEFIVQGNDPNFQIDLDGVQIESLILDVNGDFGVDDILLYYANKTSDFSEGNKLKPITKTEDGYVFDLRDTGAIRVRIDIDGNFIYNSIKTSQNSIHLEETMQDVNTVRVIGAVLMPMIVVLALYFTNITKKMSEKFIGAFKKFVYWFKRNKLNVVFSAVVYVVIGGVSALAEFAYCHIVQRVPNSMGVYFDYYRFLFIFCALATVFTLYLLRKVAGKKPEYLFLSVVLIAGTMLTLTYQSYTGNAWDDQIHYKWAVTAPVVTDGSYTKIEKENFDLSFKRPNDNYNYKEIKETRDQEKDSENSGSDLVLGKEKQGVLSLYERLGHLPAAITIQIFRTFDAAHATQLFFARMANLVVYALVMFFAIKKLKTGKMILTVLALIPAFVFLATNFSYDYWVTAFLALGFAYFLDEWQHPNQMIETKNLAIMMGSFVLGCGPKSVYFLFALLPLLLKKSKTKNYKKFVIICGSCCGFVIAAFLAISFLNISAGGDMRGGADVSTTGQIKFILSNPIEFTKILLSFLKNYIKIENFTPAFTSVAYINTPGGQIGILFTVLLFVVAFTDKNEHDLYLSNWKSRISMLLFLFVECVLVTTALYISYNPVGSVGIGGVQLRYIFPMLFPVFAVIGTTNIKNNIDRRIYNYSVIGISSALFYIYFWGCHMTFFY